MTDDKTEGKKPEKKKEKKEDAPVVPAPHIDTLLPPAQVHLFSTDKKTIETFEGLIQDWRFGRMAMGVRGDDLGAAIAYYSRRKSPTMIIIQTDTTDQEFQDRLEDLAEVCNEGTAAIVVGPVNDVQLYRHLTTMGISDYLVKPLGADQMVEAIARTLQELIGAVDSHLMALVGVKGGVGTTTVTSMVAHCLSQQEGSKVLVMDTSGGASTLWSQFGFTPSGTLIEAAKAVVDKDDDAFNRLIVKTSDKLHIINSGAESILDNPVAPQAFEMLLDKCLSIYPYVILDLSNSQSQIKRMVMARANSIGVVATPRVPDLSLTKLLLKSFSEMPGADQREPHIIVNKTDMVKSIDVKNADIVEALDIEETTDFPFNAALFADAENSGDLLFEQPTYKKTYIKSLETLITKMTGKQSDEGDDAKSSESSGGLFSFLKGGE